MTTEIEEAQEEPFELKCPLCLENNRLRVERNKLYNVIIQRLRGRYNRLFAASRANIADRVRIRREIAILKKLLPDCPENKDKIQVLDEELSHLIYLHETLGKRIRIATGKFIKETPDGQKYSSMHAKLRQLTSDHPKCTGCAMLFGRYHLAIPVIEIKGLKYCQYCQKDIARDGEKVFLKRVRASRKEDSLG